MSCGSACSSRTASFCTASRSSSTCTTLAIEDAEHPHQRPKLEHMATRCSSWRARRRLNSRVSFGETHLFVGKGYIVTGQARRLDLPYATVRQHWESCPTALAKGEDFILYAILDFIARQLACRCSETIQDEVDEIEGLGAEQADDWADIERLYMLRRRDLLRLRNAADPGSRCAAG